MTVPEAARRLEITGVVQGVGFRPFLFQLADEYGLAGEVTNTSRGVSLVIQGSAAAMDRFSDDIMARKPPLALIREIRTLDVEPAFYDGFVITRSRPGDGRKTALIPPDVSVCRDCLREMTDPSDRRYRYPFINCTNCGPRYTIIQDIPYDRPMTSMSVFPMCPRCRKEYDDPLDRRFHAQPNACPDCGPQAFLTDAAGNRMPAIGTDPVAQAARLLGEGRILGIKGLGGFHLAVNAADSEAVQKLRDRKQRPHKPFALMARDLSVIRPHVWMSAAEEDLLESIHRPIVLLRKRPSQPEGASGLASSLAPANRRFGVMLPYTPLHYLLLNSGGPEILVMTSGNRSGEPLSIDNDDALEAFAHIADYFLLHNRDIYFRADDSISLVQAGEQRFIRRSRGFSPMPVFLEFPLPGVLACGAGLKNTICLTKENRAFLSQHIGDLDDMKTYAFYKKSIDHLKRILDIEPELVAHDLHPDYMSTRYAREESGLKAVGVQHHHAHAVACMAEHGIDRKVIALTLDGTGYGTDGTIWGGEILTCTHGDFERRAHLSTTPMPGGDAAVLEPWRMGAAWLYRVFGDRFLEMDLPLVREAGRRKLEFICRMIDRRINSPMTSSCGRLFDAIAAIAGVRQTISFESQAAMELEAAAAETDEGDYDTVITAGTGTAGAQVLILDPGPCVRGVVEDVLAGRDLAGVSAAFHAAVVRLFVEAAARISRETGIREAVLSGGVFNNTRILEAMITGLEKRQITVYSHQQVPAGDGGIALGQAVAAARMERIRA